MRIQPIKVGKTLVDAGFRARFQTMAKISVYGGYASFMTKRKEKKRYRQHTENPLYQTKTKTYSKEACHSKLTTSSQIKHSTEAAVHRLGLSSLAWVCACVCTWSPSLCLCVPLLPAPLFHASPAPSEQARGNLRPPSGQPGLSSGGINRAPPDSQGAISSIISGAGS